MCVLVCVGVNGTNLLFVVHGDLGNLIVCQNFDVLCCIVCFLLLVRVSSAYAL